jgi:hypothetical protein
MVSNILPLKEVTGMNSPKISSIRDLVYWLRFVLPFNQKKKEKKNRSKDLRLGVMKNFALPCGVRKVGTHQPGEQPRRKIKLE